MIGSDYKNLRPMLAQFTDILVTLIRMDRSDRYCIDEKPKHSNKITSFEFSIKFHPVKHFAIWFPLAFYAELEPNILPIFGKFHKQY